MNRPSRNASTRAFFLQAVLSFVLSLAALTVGIAYLPVDAWVRAFLAVGVFYAVTSTFTLAKCVRDRQEDEAAAVTFRTSN
ncbi:YiaA/YiaB family inner membrane protein [Acrocarpospora catenulata]|uniref:YiaA/YiaB family inner membrane protein n=1 Tax=Acrocarpospora catenulata TaxID=2836182 RepID=UPI001BD97940|nr:YiaA/YiaB family inner membrane protein [Acrocarpospora catenulata]